MIGRNVIVVIYFCKLAPNLSLITINLQNIVQSCNRMLYMYDKLADSKGLKINLR